DVTAADWDVRDQRGRSARVFAPGARARERREKKWHERVANQRVLLGSLAAAGTVAGAVGSGLLLRGLTRQRQLTVLKGIRARRKSVPAPTITTPSNVVPMRGAAG